MAFSLEFMGKKLAELRAERGLTQEAAAASVGISDKSLSKYETGTAAPDLAVLSSLADFYGVTADELLGRSAPEDPEEENRELKELYARDPAEAITRHFEHSHDLLQEAYGLFTDEKPEYYPKNTLKGPAERSLLNLPALYELFVNSDEVNLALTLTGCRNNFRWLTDGEKTAKLAELFAALAEPGMLPLMRTLYRSDLPNVFTAACAASRSGIEAEQAEALLDRLAALGLASSETAHLLAGERKLYGWDADGELLALTAAAYDLLFRSKWYANAYNGKARLVRAGENETEQEGEA